MKIFSFLLIIVVFSACEKTVTIDIPRKAPKLVVNALLEKNQPIELLVGKSRYILEPNNNSTVFDTYIVKDAVAVVYENNIAIDTLVYQANEYKYKTTRNKLVVAGNTYTVKVTAPGYAAVEATTTVPSQSEIGEVKRVRDAKVNSDGEHFDEITIKLNDPAEKNFYLVQFYQAGFGAGNEIPIYCVSTTDKDIEQIGDDADPLSTDNCYDGTSLIMTDINFNGREKQLRFYIHSFFLHEITLPNGQTDYPAVKLSRITEEYFKFIKSFNAYTMSVDNPFAEPVNVFGNVLNGFGIFSARTSVSRPLP
jgi:hypothetical protein